MTQAFDHAVDALTEFRNIHIKTVGRYIVAPSRARTAAAADANVSKAIETSGKVNIASVSSRAASGDSHLKGTGGTDLITFLKQTRDETRAAEVGLRSGETARQVLISCE